MAPALPPGAHAITPVRARVPRDVVTTKKGKGRVLDEKPVTRCNSARLSFAIRVENRGSFVKEPAARGSFPPRAVVRLGHAPAWAVLRVTLLWAEARELGRKLESGFFNFQ